MCRQKDNMNVFYINSILQFVLDPSGCGHDSVFT